MRLLICAVGAILAFGLAVVIYMPDYSIPAQCTLMSTEQVSVAETIKCDVQSWMARVGTTLVVTFALTCIVVIGGFALAIQPFKEK